MAEMKESGTTWFGMIPKDWELSKISSIYELRTQKVSDKDYPPLSVTMNGIVPQLDSAAKTNAHDDRKLVKRGDFAINSRSDRRGSCGVSEYDGSVSLINTVMKPRDEINPDYYNWLFHTIQFADEFYKWGHGIVDDLWTTNWQDMKHIDIPVPTLDEQKVIADYLNKAIPEIDALHTDIEKQIETLEEYKKSIITEAVTKGLDPDVEMEDSGISYIGNIPKHWKVTNLKYLGKCQNGISKGGEYFGNGFPFVSYGDVYKNYSLPQNVDGLIMSTKTEQNIYSVKYGDVFFTRTSETIEEIGFASTCLKSIDNSVFAGFLIRFRPTSNDLIPEFSKFYFRSNIHRKFFVKEMNLVTRASLSQNLLGRLPVLLPPLCEQQMIAKNLEKKCSEIDGAIEEKKEQLDTLEQYKKSLIYEYVTGKKEVK